MYLSIRTFLKPLSFLPAIAIMYMIFTFSSQEGDISSQYSYKASVTIVKTADYIFDLELDSWQIDNYAVRIHGVTRKLAHMGEYFLLAIAVSFPLYVYGLHGILLVLVAGLICIGYAAGDEYHQSLVAGRSAQYKDVGIDSVGVLIGIVLVRIIGWTGRHTIFRPRKRKDRYSRKELRRMRREQEQMEDEMREREAFEELERRRALKEERRLAQQRQKAARHDDRCDDRYDDCYDDRRGERYDDRIRGYDPRYADPYDEEYDRHYRDPQDEYYLDDFVDEDTSDELSSDMPFSHLLNHRNRE